MNSYNHNSNHVQNNQNQNKKQAQPNTINNSSSNNFESRKQPIRNSKEALGKIGAIPETRSSARLKEQQVKNEVSKQSISNQSNNNQNINNNQLKRKRDENAAVKEVKEEIPNNSSKPKNKPESDDMFMATANNDFPEQV
jgi:hypothetical protein